MPTTTSDKMDQANTSQDPSMSKSEMVESSANPFTFDDEVVAGGFRFVARQSMDLIPFMTVLNLMATGDSNFMSAFLNVLKSAPFKAFFFETPPVTETKVLGNWTRSYKQNVLLTLTLRRN